MEIKITKRFYVGIIGVVVMLLTMYSCMSKNDPQPEKNTIDSIKVDLEEEVISMKLKNQLYNLPSPHHASLLVKNNGIQFYPDLTNPVENSTKYVNNLKKALNIGIYGTDLGYLNIYNQNQKSYLYFDVINKLAQQLKLTSVIDEQTYLKIKNNINNSDSLVLYLSETYHEIDKHLKLNDREDIGNLILAGGWIESMYIVSQHFLLENNNLLFIYLGEQKYPLDHLIEILSPYYYQSEEYARLIDEFVELAYIFDAIEFNYEHEEQIQENNRIKLVSQSEMKVFDEILTKISIKISGIRKRIVE
ncbi:MAG: hypothetical protein ACOCUL_00605 [Bacteroidota bacterium]